jgi:integrase
MSAKEQPDFIEEKPISDRLACKIVSLHPANTPEPTRIDQNHKTTSNARAVATLPAHHLRYAGRKWRMIKRSLDPDASWYLDFQRDKQRHLISLKTAAKVTAEAEARSYVDALLTRGRAVRSGLTSRSGKTCSLLSDIIGRAELWPDDLGIVTTLPISANFKSRKAYVWALRWVLRHALDLTDAEVDGLRADVFSKDTARKFWGNIMAAANAIPDQTERNRYLRNASTFWNSSKALLAPLPVDAMTTAGLVLPDLQDWRNGRKLFLREKVGKAATFHRPADIIIRRTFVEWMRLAGAPQYAIPGLVSHGPELSPLYRRNMFIAVGLALSCGLRAGEFAGARWEWFQNDGGRPVLDAGKVNVKNRSGRLRVRPLDPFWTILNRTVDRHGWRGAPGDYCLTTRAEVIRGGGESDRLWLPQMLVSKWLRWLGWETQKTNHALRDLSASYVTMKYGLGRAKIFCRHGQLATTETHYNGFVDADNMDDPKRLAWLRWAK